MKKAMLVAVVSTALALNACAQKLKESEVPAAVKVSFAKQYPGITAKWEKEDGKYEAGFKKEGKNTSVLYEANGTMTEIETDITVKELPAQVVTYVKEHYSGQRIKEAAKITKADGTINYEAEVNSKDLIFDESGKFLKEVKD